MEETNRGMLFKVGGGGGGGGLVTKNMKKIKTNICFKTFSADCSVTAVSEMHGVGI